MSRKTPSPITATMHQQRFDAEIAQILADTRKALAEAEKLRKESQWYPFVAGAALFAAAAAFAKLFM